MTVDATTGGPSARALSPLARAFSEAWRAASASPSPPVGLDAVDAERRLAAIVARGREAHPELSLDSELFIRQVARCVARTLALPLEAAESLAIDDLYLAGACAVGAGGAAATFERLCGTRMRAALATVVKSTDLRAEVEQHARDVLLIGAGKAAPKITEYRGQGPLGRWVSVVATGLAISVVRADQTELRVRDAAARELAPAVAQPEIELARKRYREDFESALGEAISALDPRRKVLLRLQLVRGISVEKIGKMYGVSQSTASRWLAEAREAIRDEMDRLMRGRLDLSRDELASLAGLVASQLDLSMSRLLKGTTGAG
ncbi:MAG TPA: sigma-70 family RNA polymerase sigma factor [Polyangia bacterium]|nr:sigma-70 family RNA polymerase sigma factor [Polyangia bacterium]